ncbi:ABC transporter permease [Gemella cuniculi]|uniref:ABC transporter permease n=1 Tax=Gemella cuniculi TaxID=150240 RepID=UPI0004093CF8|nr:ABC transporter permease [Gemella cuniculi]
MEFRRALNNKLFLFIILSSYIMFIFGYILLKTIDNINQVNYYQFVLSAYTVFTQFGPLIISIPIINFINIDYKEKNIIFYKTLNYTVLEYFFKKIFVVCFWYFVSTISMLVMLSLYYQNYQKFEDFVIICFYFISVIISTLLISGIFAYLFSNILFSFGVNIIFWILGIVVNSMLGGSSIFAFFDATNKTYKGFEKYFSTGDYNVLNISEILIYVVSILTLILIVLKVMKKSWIKNGI